MKKTRTQTRKLKLNRETLRLLDKKQLSQVAGGWTCPPNSAWTCLCQTK